ncbi:MAG: ribosomal protein S18-alanine N-acetyltransferase [Pseudomonadota bacterium]
MKAIGFRILGRADTSELAELHCEGFDRPWDEKSILDVLARPNTVGIGAISGNNPDLRAFVLFQRVEDEAEILTIVVSSSERRQGVATALLQNGKQHLSARGCTKLFLEVAEDNVAALLLYKRLGFRVEGKRRKYYSRPGFEKIDALIMCRAITRLP